VVTAADPALNDLIDEVTNKLQAREPFDLEAFIAEHPGHADSLRRLLPALQVLADLSHSRAKAIHAQESTNIMAAGHGKGTCHGFQRRQRARLYKCR
jgi:hypothetical protein